MPNRDFFFSEDILGVCPADWFELSYVKHGHGTRVAYDMKQEIKTEDWFLTEPGKGTGFESADTLQVYRFFFPPTFIDTAMRGCTTLKELCFSPLIGFPYHIPSSFSGSTLFSDAEKTVCALFESIKSEDIRHERGYAEYIRCFSLQIILQICRSITYVQSQSLDEQYIRGIYDYCIDHYMENIKLSDLCQLANYSLSHVSEQFKKVTGMNFRDFLQKTRISQSCRYLVSCNRSVEEIAALCGYKDMHTFFRVFKTYTGMTPHQYRLKNSNHF
ncbi:MAG: helix-turn-helix transcriptional regulator [Clostridia bacterium]|nr:helix-turn-helix transcriptional regulator [Clostridia bacterium]